MGVMISPVMMVVGVPVRTGRVICLSATGLTVVAAAILAKRDAPPDIARQLVHFLMQGHWLAQIGENSASSSHSLSSKGLF